jgi:hypothetical protein
VNEATRAGIKEQPTAIFKSAFPEAGVVIGG